jgi:hypothetical protein
LEAGYSEQHNALIEDTDLLLVGTQGRIGLVIVIKIEPLKANETMIQDGFIQVYKYDRQMNRRARYGGRMVKSYYASFFS